MLRRYYGCASVLLLFGCAVLGDLLVVREGRMTMGLDVIVGECRRDSDNRWGQDGTAEKAGA